MEGKEISEDQKLKLQIEVFLNALEDHEGLQITDENCFISWNTCLDLLANHGKFEYRELRASGNSKHVNITNTEEHYH